MGTNAEEADLIQAARSGGKAFDALLLKYDGLLRNQCRRFAKLPTTPEMLWSVAAEALWLATKTWQLGGVQFSFWAQRAVRSKLARARLRDRVVALPEHVAKDERMELCDHSALALTVEVARTLAAPAENDTTAMLHDLAARLPPAYRRVILARLNDVEYPEMAAEIGVSKQRCKQMEAAAVREMRRLVEGKEPKLRDVKKRSSAKKRLREGGSTSGQDSLPRAAVPQHDDAVVKIRERRRRKT